MAVIFAMLAAGALVHVEDGNAQEAFVGGCFRVSVKLSQNVVNSPFIAAGAVLSRCRNSAPRASHLRRRLQRVCCRRCDLTATSRRCGGWANIQALFQKN